MPQPQASGAPGDAHASSRATFGQVVAVGEFRALWLAQLLSVAGDQLARVALTLLVYDRTRSPLLAAVTFAASVLPAFVGGITLAGLADLLPRREVMIGCDLIRAALVAAMVVPGLPVAALVGLLFVVTLVGAPFSSARAAMYPDVLHGDLYVVGTAVTMTTVQVAQVAGFATGGVAAALLGVSRSLLLDAATFVLSALITLAWVRRRPVSGGRQTAGAFSWSDVGGGIRLVFGSDQLRGAMLLGWLAAFVDAFEGIAAPLARQLGGGPVVVGMILALGALGAGAGSIVFSRVFGAGMRRRLMAPLAVASCAVLIPLAAAPSLATVLVIVTLSGAFSCYQVAANARFVAATPIERRGQAFGIAQGGMSLGQSTTMVLAGAAIHFLSPTGVVSAAGLLGAFLGVAIAATGRRDTPR